MKDSAILKSLQTYESTKNCDTNIINGSYFDIIWVILQVWAFTVF